MVVFSFPKLNIHHHIQIEVLVFDHHIIEEDNIFDAVNNVTSILVEDEKELASQNNSDLEERGRN